VVAVLSKLMKTLFYSSLLVCLIVSTLLILPAQAETVIGSTDLPTTNIGQAAAQSPTLAMIQLEVPPLQYPQAVIVPLQQQRLPMYARVERIGFTAQVQGIQVNVFRFSIG
jgi:hypothetical protein